MGDTYNTTKSTLTSNLPEYIGGIGKLNSVPELPPHYLPRKEYIDYIKQSLTNNSGNTLNISSTNNLVGIQGMGGIGKSVLATAIARDEEIRKIFVDGIYWITIGQEPSITLRQGQLLEAIGNEQRVFRDEQEGKARLHEVLRDKICLIVLDDIWQSRHEQAFNVPESKSKLLITTRDISILKSLGAVEHQLELLSDQQAKQLLAKWVRLSEQALPLEATELINECGNLPLALAMIGAMLRSRPNLWQNILHKLKSSDLEKIKQEFPNYPYPTLMRAMQVSVEALDESLQARYLDFALFQEDIPIAENVLVTLWKKDGLSEFDSQDIINELTDKSLLRRDKNNLITLHDLQFDYIRKQAKGIKLLHKKLLDAYKEKCSGKWDTLSNDGYIISNLIWHMQQAGCENEIHALLNEETPQGKNAWYELKKQLGQVVEYIEDISTARKIANDSTEKEIKSNLSGKSLCLDIRYALITSSLNSLAHNIPISLVKALVKHQLWSVKQAYKYGCQARWSALKLIDIVQDSPYLEEVSRKSLAEIEKEREGYWMFETLGKLMPFLEGAKLEKALEIALLVLKEKNDEGYALYNITPYLNTIHLEKILLEVKSFKSEKDKMDGLLALLPQFVKNEKCSTVVEEIYSIQNGEMQLSIIFRVFPLLLDPYKTEILNYTLSKYEQSSNESYKVSILKELSPFLDLPLLQSLLDQVKNFRNKALIGKALIGLLPRMAELGFIEIALQEAKAIGNEEEKVDALIGILPYLTKSLFEATILEIIALSKNTYITKIISKFARDIQTPLLNNLLETILIIEDKEIKTLLILDLLPQIKIFFSPEYSLSIVREYLEGIDKIKGLVKLKNLLTKTDWQKILLLIKKLPQTNSFYESPQVTALKQVAPHLSEELMEIALEIAADLPDSARLPIGISIRAEAIDALAPYLSISLTQKALTIVEEIGDKASQALSLAKMSAHMPTSQLQQVVDMLHEIESSYDQVDVISYLTPFLPEPMLKQLLSTIKDIKTSERKATILSTITEYLPEPLLRDALTMAYELPQESHEGHLRSRSLVGFPSRFAKLGCLDQAYAVAKNIYSRHYQSYALAEMALRLAEIGLPKEALSAIESIVDQDTKASTLIKLIETSKDVNLKQAFRIAKRLDTVSLYGSPKISSLVKLIPKLCWYLKRKAINEIKTAFAGLENNYSKQKVLSQSIADFILLGYSYEQLLKQIELLNDDIGFSSPRAEALHNLLPHLPEKLLPEASSIAKTIHNPYSRDLVRISFITRLAKQGNLEEAIRIYDVMKYKDRKIKALSGLTPYLPVVYLKRFFRDILNDINEPYQKGLISSLITSIPKLSTLEFYDVWLDVLPILSFQKRNNSLVNLTAILPILTSLGGESITRELFNIVLKVGRWWP